jgi:hypothetical protein
MISKIYFDNDQTLSHTEYFPCSYFEHDFTFNLGNDTYVTKVNPHTIPLLNFARNLVGEENVFMLTAATKPFAAEIDRLGGFGFGKEKILDRFDINRFLKTPKYQRPKDHLCTRSVLIDNLFPRDSEEKIMFLGMTQDYQDRYCQVFDFYGTPSENFETDVIDFLKRAHDNLK